MNVRQQIRFLGISIDDPQGDPIGVRMQKNLKHGTTYSFYQSVDVTGNAVSLPKSSAEKLYDIGEEGEHLNISICAIVGENGAGKSTLLDTVIRILNNLSAYILGECYRTPGAEHLHYIHNVYATLYVQIDDRIISITCENEKLFVYDFQQQEKTTTYIKNSAYPIIKDIIGKTDICDKRTSLFGFLRGFCYTVVNNYSLYSYATVNYKDEFTDYKKENKIRQIGFNDGYDIKTLEGVRADITKGRNTMTYYRDARSWLQGLFRKNDGYQAPLVICPMREGGRIDLLKEHKLAKERLVSLLFMRDEVGDYFFNRINGKLVIDAIEISKDFNESNKYERLNASSEFLPNLERPLFMDVYGTIKQAVMAKCEFQDEKRDHSVLVWNYIVQKILKIIFTYPRYKTHRESLQHIVREFDNQRALALVDMVGSILEDHSHVTRKLYRSIYYLKYSHIDKKKRLTVKDFGNEIYNLVEQEKDKSIYSPQVADELLPPPAFYVDFQFYDINDEGKNNKIDFSTLSSGEKQITYLQSSFFYQLINIDSSGFVLENRANNGDVYDFASEFLTYKHVCALFDEIELYFHPEMQRTFVSYLLDGLQQLRFRKLLGVQIIMATHSPFILSDIPSDNVLFLGKNGYPKEMNDLYTFGANIHSMLRHSFFLENGSMGEFVQQKIRETQCTINHYLLWRQIRNIITGGFDVADQTERLEYLRACNYKQFKSLNDGVYERWLEWDWNYEIETEKKDQENVKIVIDLIQEPLVRTVMLEQYNKWIELCGY